MPNLRNAAGDVLALPRELSAAAERGDMAEVVRLAGMIAACGEPHSALRASSR